MRILALDTSSNVAAVAVMEDNVILGEYTLNHEKKHSEKMMPMISMLLRDLELTAAEMDFFAVSTGPGSFTGLRIGITTIKTMAYICQKPVIPVPTLDSLACNVPVHDGLVCPMMDARNNQVYTAVYRQKGSERERISGYIGVKVMELAGILQEEQGDIAFTGDGSIMHRDFFEKSLGERVCFTPETMSLQKASHVARLAGILALSGKAGDSFEVLPFYLRKSQAEREYEKRKERNEG